MGVQLWGRHSLKGHLWQLPAASLEQMGMQCLHPRVRTGPPLSARVESGSSIRQLLPLVPEWCAPIPVRYYFCRVDAALLLAIADGKQGREAAFYRAVLYEHGLGVPVDRSRALQLHKTARQRGSILEKAYEYAVHMAHLEYGDVAGGGGEQIACAVAAGSCPQAPQEYDRLVRLLLCLYTERGSATARRALAALLQDERRMNDEAIP